MSGELHPSWHHQLKAKAFIHHLWNTRHPGAMAAICMGGGKTKLTIDLISEIGASLILILAPLRIVDVWEFQLQQHANFPYVFCGLDDRVESVAAKARAARDAVALARASKQACIICVNYESAWREPFASWALNTAWPLIVAEESHRIKSASGRASRFMGRLGVRAARRLCLTGTPLPHSPLDLWAQYRFLDPSIFDSTYSSFKTRYAEWGGFQNRQVKKWRDMDDFNAKFYSVAFRVTKEEALDLPPEMDQTLRCELTREGRAVYDRLENDFVAWLGETPEEQITVQNALVLLLRLQQLTGGTLRDDSGEEHVVDTAKESALAEWLEDLDPKEPAVIFANFTADLDAIRRAAERAGHTCAEVSGRSPDGIATWKAGRANILAAQIRIASEGQDFTRAAYCCYYSLGFSLLHYIQSRARIHRPGQTRPVTYYHLLATNTIDEIVLRAVQNRWELVESVLKEMKKHVPRLVR
jgi:SNF2 family DNA or RNA helicase